MRSILFTNDFLFHSTRGGTYHLWLYQILKTPIERSTGLPCIPLENFSGNNDKPFSRTEFYHRSNLQEPGDYAIYDLNEFSEDSWKYLRSYINDNSLILGVELGEDIRNKLTEFNIPYISFWFHPFKLFDDAFFLLTTNNESVYEKLKAYKKSESCFFSAARYWKAVILRKYFDDKNLAPNSLLFIGQTLYDKSVCSGKKFLNILDFKEKIYEFSQKYTKIYYIPHPNAQYRTEINDYLEKTSYIETISNIPTYYLLASDKIKKVVSLSSSVLYEAQFFDKETEYLFQPLFDIDSDFGKNSYISIYNHYFNPSFWSDILSPLMPTNLCTADENIPTIPNKLRNIINNYYGYAHLDDLTLLRARVDNVNRDIEGQHRDITALDKNLKELEYQMDTILNILPRWLCKLICLFIWSKKKRKAFRKKFEKR